MRNKQTFVKFRQFKLKTIMFKFKRLVLLTSRPTSIHQNESNRSIKNITNTNKTEFDIKMSFLYLHFSFQLETQYVMWYLLQCKFDHIQTLKSFTQNNDFDSDLLEWILNIVFTFLLSTAS